MISIKKNLQNQGDGSKEENDEGIEFNFSKKRQTSPIVTVDNNQKLKSGT